MSGNIPSYLPSLSSYASQFVASASQELPPGLGELLQAILLDCKNRRLSEATARNRVYVAANFLRWVAGRGFLNLSQVRGDDVKHYFAEDRRGRNTVTLSAGVLRHYFKELQRMDLADATPKLTFRFQDDFEVLTEDDVAAMLKATSNLQWQLRLLILWETGARASEICTLRLRDIRIDNYGAVVMLRGKTKPRPRRLIKCVKLLEKYLGEHPWKEDPGAPFLYAERGKRREFLKTLALDRMVQTLAKRAGIGKKVWTHLLRHSAATSEASDFTDAELEELYGWVKGSGMPKRYRHKIDIHKLEVKQLRLAGIQIPEEETRSPLAPRICPRCSEQNAPLARYCVRCSMVLDHKLAKEIQAREDKAKSILNVLVEDPEFFGLMVQKIRDKGLDQG